MYAGLYDLKIKLILNKCKFTFVRVHGSSVKLPDTSMSCTDSDFCQDNPPRLDSRYSYCDTRGPFNMGETCPLLLCLWSTRNRRSLEESSICRTETKIFFFFLDGYTDVIRRRSFVVPPSQRSSWLDKNTWRLRFVLLDSGLCHHCSSEWRITQISTESGTRIKVNLRSVHVQREDPMSIDVGPRHYLNIIGRFSSL